MQPVRISDPASTGLRPTRRVSSSILRWMCWAAPLLLAFCRISSPASEAPRTVVRPAYRIDLRSVIDGPFVIEPIGHPESRVGLPIRSVCFLDDQRLAVTVVTQAKGKPELAMRGEPSPSSAFRLNAAILEASSGKVLGTPEWPSNSRYAGIVAANDKGFVTQRGGELTLFGPDAKPIRHIELPPLPSDQYGHDNNWVPHSSWSGKRVLLLGGRVSMSGPWIWLDAENLQILRSWEDMLNLPITASDNELVMATRTGHPSDPPRTLLASEPGGNWMPIPSTANLLSVQFVASDLLYAQYYSSIGQPGRSGAFLIRTDGTAVYRLEPPRKGWGLGRATASRSGMRFVILVGETKGRYPALDIGGHSVLRGFLVFDPPFRTLSYTLEVRDSRLRNPDIPALSPDGRHLAVFAYPDPILEIYELPPTN